MAIIGAGAGGICTAVALRRLGIDEFTIFEQSDGVGGTWHDNVYPGAEVDIPVPFYSFSFHSFDFSRNYVRQAELLRYLESVCERFRLHENLQLSTAIVRAVWDESTHSYEVYTADGGMERFDVVVSAVGLLNHPKLPDWPGLESFAGPCVHSSRWDPGLEITGKRVAVVGTGSSGVQLVPAIASEVEELYVFQRQPGWILPKDDRENSAADRARLIQPAYRRWTRTKQWWRFERAWQGYIEGSRTNVLSKNICEGFIHDIFKDRPDLEKLVTPDYPFGGKRPVRDSNFYPALLRDNVHLVPHAVTEVREKSIVDETDGEYDVDVIVMCTGFQATNFLATLEVVGRDGRTIHEVWNGDAQAYLGLTVAGFPNFYMVYGPNTNGAPIMFMHERQADFIAANLKRMIRYKFTAIEVRREVMDCFNWIIQKRLSKVVMARHPEVHNYGRSRSGRNVIGWGEGMAVYSLLTHTTPRLSSVARRRNPDRAESPQYLRRRGVEAKPKGDTSPAILISEEQAHRR